MNIMISNHFWILNYNKQWVHPRIKNSHIDIQEYELFKFDKHIKGSNKLVHNTKGVRTFHNANCYYFSCDVTNVFIYDNTLGSNGHLQLIVRPHISSIEINHIVKYLGNLDNDLPVSFIHELSKYFNMKLNYRFFDNNISHKVSLMMKYLNRVVMYFHDLCSHKMDYSLQKHYDKSVIPKRSDPMSIKLNILNYSRFKEYGPNYYLTYDISANQFIKQILKDIIYFISQGINHIRENLNGINNYYYYYYILHDKYNRYYENDKQECVKCINLFKICSNRLKYIDKKFLNKITNKRMSYPPKKILMSFKYNVIYKYYLKIKEIEFYFSSNYIIEQSRKQNCYLYEVWTYFALLCVLKKSKYKLISYPKHPVQYFLNHDIDFTFSKELDNNKYIRIDAVYNIKLTGDNKRMPLKIVGKHYNPDIILNVSFLNRNKKYYLGTIIMDAKCMYREAIPVVHNNVCHFIDYISKGRLSKYGKNEIGQKYSYSILNNYNPVDAVFALYPISSKYPKMFDSKEPKLKKYLTYQQLNPLKKSDLAQFKSRILKCIEYCLIINSNLSLKDVLEL